MENPKILAVLVNYGDEQINYLETVVNGLKSFVKYDVTVVVNSNIPLDIKNIDKVNVIKLNNYQMLPLTCRKTIWENRNKYDIFLYGENDHLFLEEHIDKHLEYISIIPDDRITGLIQYEEDCTGRYYPAYHGKFCWDENSVEIYGNKVFAHFTNLHQATFIITKEQLIRIGKMHDFTEFFVSPKSKYYSVKCKVNTDIYEFCGMKKIICISEFSKNQIHHLPNLYINGERNRRKQRSDEKTMNGAVEKLLKTFDAMNTDIPLYDNKRLIDLFYEEVISSKPSCFCEVGAFDAYASRHIAKNLKDCKVYAFEADPNNYKRFSKTIDNRVDYKHFAISDKEEEGVFYIQNVNRNGGVRNNSLYKRSTDSKDGYTPYKIQIKKLDSVVYEEGFSYALWIDVEGKGYEALIGSEKVLENTHLIFIEVEDEQYWKGQKLSKDIIEFLQSKGFKPIARDKQFGFQYNIIFKRVI